MPIQITLPAQAELPFGPGASFDFGDTTLGPWPVDDQVTLRLYSTDNETVLAEAGFVDVQSNRWSGNWLFPDLTTVAWNFIRDASNVPIDAPIRLSARRHHANGTLVSQDDIQVKWAPTQFTWFLQFWDLFLRRSSQGNFLPSDRDLLEHIDTGIWLNFPNG